MITIEDCYTLFEYLSNETLDPESDIKKVFDKVKLITEIDTRQKELRDIN